ncbi:MAG: polysaccharide deacetylase family protein [Gammaproteobacteria bacterium]
MTTKVCITIDTEFSIGGAFGNAARLPVGEQMVLCNVNGRSEGLGFMLDTFRRHRVQATFFVETVHRYHFRDDPMRALVHRIRDAGHDLQLHSHPCWSLFQHADWRERARSSRRQDDYFGRSVDDSVRLIEQGVETFADWGLPRPTVFRSGNLQHDDNLYLALARTGIPYASNVAVAIFDSGLPDYRVYSGQHVRHGVTEFPVLTFSDWKVGGRQHLKSLTIAGTSFAETRTLLERARAAGIPLVVLLTHPFEYVQSSDSRLAHVRRHSVNQGRLTRLCQYLDQHRDRFEAVGLAQAAAAVAPGPSANALVSGKLWQSLPRMATQVAYDKFGQFLLAATKGKRESVD